MNSSNLQNFFEVIGGHNFIVTFWDGKTTRYGEEEPEFRIVFNKEPSLSDIADDPIIFLGEAYMRGDIELSGSFEAMARALEAVDDDALKTLGGGLAGTILSGLNAVRSLTQQKEDIAAHYDLGNDFFSLWLDKSTTSYSCAYFRKPEDSLDLAQQQKGDLILKKLHLQPGMRLLDIGCGWGWLSTRAAKEYGARVLGITLSEEQFKAVSQKIKDNGLDDRLEVRLCNYLDLEEKGAFDRVVSVGMYEHVGRAHQHQYFEKVRDLLKPGGLSLLHTLTKLKPVDTNPWIKKYIFPGGYIPPLSEVIDLTPVHDFHVLHVESLRRHYAETLARWHANFTKPEVLAKVREMFDEKFVRMWSLYLQMARACLCIGSLDIHQIVFTKSVNNDLPMTLESVYR